MSSGSALPHQHTLLQQQEKDKLGKDAEGHQSDVNKMKNEADGSWKRAPSTFRNFIQEGGEFPPEKGLLGSETALIHNLMFH